MHRKSMWKSMPKKFRNLTTKLLKNDIKTIKNHWKFNDFLEHVKPWFLRHVCSENVILRVLGVSKINGKSMKIHLNSRFENVMQKWRQNHLKWRQNGSPNHSKIHKNSIKKSIRQIIAQKWSSGGQGAPGEASKSHGWLGILGPECQ